MTIKEISKRNNDLSIINQVLKNRGVANTKNFFNLSWDNVSSPYNLDNIEEAANKILEHIKTSKTIAILVDPDADGYLSSAILLNYIQDSKYCLIEDNIPRFKILHHNAKVHGLDDITIMKDLRDLIKPALLIIPDASGTVVQYRALNDLGIEIVTLDHHQVPNINIEKTIVVNNQHSEQYINKDLSGAGIVWQLCRVLDNLLAINLAYNYLDLVAAALVGDVMNLTSDETRFLIQEGLKSENIKNPFLQHCLFVNDYSLQGQLTPTKVAFNIVPLFNAIARIGTLSEKTILFESLLTGADTKMIPSGNRNKKGEMVSLVTEAYRIVSNAKARQKRRQDKFMELVDNIIEAEFLHENKVMVITIAKDDFEEEHRALAGLVANKLLDIWKKPIFILFENEDGTYSGSCRAPDNIEAFSNFREQCEDSRLTIYSAGHNSAFGSSMMHKNTFLLQDYFNNKYKDIEISSSYECDFIVDAEDSELIDIIKELSNYDSLWGQGLKQPFIAIKNVKIKHGKVQIVGAQKGKPTLKITLDNGVVCIKFGSSIEEYESLHLPYTNDIEQYYNLTLVGIASMNEFRGEKTPQILITDYCIDGVEYDF